MHFSILRQPLAHYFTPVLIIALGALFAFVCLFIVLIQSLVKLIMIPPMLMVGLGALIWDQKKIPARSSRDSG
jgi:hypothetical protein